MGGGLLDDDRRGGSCDAAVEESKKCCGILGGDFGDVMKDVSSIERDLHCYCRRDPYRHSRCYQIVPIKIPVAVRIEILVLIWY